MSRRRASRKSPRNRSSGKSFPARFETLESRTLLAVFTPTSGASLRSDIQAAEANGDAGNTIELAAGKYLLTGVRDPHPGQFAIAAHDCGGQRESYDHPARPHGIVEGPHFRRRRVGYRYLRETNDLRGQPPGGGQRQPGDGRGWRPARGRRRGEAQQRRGGQECGPRRHGDWRGRGANAHSGEQPGPGAGGQNGSAAQGGGIFLEAGTLNIVSSQISNNQAIGGNGGKGGKGVQARRGPRRHRYGGQKRREGRLPRRPGRKWHSRSEG